jgi:hypothetical protein
MADVIGIPIALPDEANSRSMTGARGSLEHENLTVASRPMFDNGLDAVVACAKLMDQRFRLSIACQGDREISISREPRLSPDGNGQAANQREGDVGSCEVGADLAQSGFERRHPDLSLTSTRRPGQSPNSAPGRSRSHLVKPALDFLFRGVGAIPPEVLTHQLKPHFEQMSVVRNALPTYRVV